MQSQEKKSRLTKFNQQWGIQLSGYGKGKKTLEKFCCSIPYVALVVPALKGCSNLVSSFRQCSYLIPRIVLAATLVGIPISLILDLIATLITQPIERRRFKRQAMEPVDIAIAQIRGPEFELPSESSEEGDEGEAETTSPVPLQSSEETIEESDSSMKIQRRKQHARSTGSKSRTPPRRKQRKHIEKDESPAKSRTKSGAKTQLERKDSQFEPMPHVSVETIESSSNELSSKNSSDYEDNSSDY